MYNFRPKIILDQTDIRILNILQDNAWINIGHLATRVFKSPTATTERIRKMQEHGVIQRYVAVVDRRLVGRPTLVVTLVRLKQHGSEILQGFAADMQVLPEVQFCLHLSGEFDFLLQVTLHDAQEYEDFLQNKLCSLEMVERVQSSFVLKECKTLTPLPL